MKEYIIPKTVVSLNLGAKNIRNTFLNDKEISTSAAKMIANSDNAGEVFKQLVEKQEVEILLYVAAMGLQFAVASLNKEFEDE